MNISSSTSPITQRPTQIRVSQSNRIGGLLAALSISVGAFACSASDEAGIQLEDDAALDAPGAPGAQLDEAVEEPSVDEELALEIAEMKMPLADLPEAIEKHASCGTNGSTGSNVRNDDAPRNGAANQRSGSSTGCVAVGVLQPSDDALYFCFTAANDGFTWTYNENLRTGVRGWTRDDLLDDNGSFTFCGF